MLSPGRGVSFASGTLAEAPVASRSPAQRAQAAAAQSGASGPAARAINTNKGAPPVNDNNEFLLKLDYRKLESQEAKESAEARLQV